MFWGSKNYFESQIRGNEPDYIGLRVINFQPTFPLLGDKHTITFYKSIGIFAIKHSLGSPVWFYIDRKENLPFEIASTGGVINWTFRMRLAQGDFNAFCYPIWTQQIELEGAQSGGNSANISIWYF